MKAEDIDLDFDDRVSYSKPSVQPKTRPNKDKNFEEKAEINMQQQPSITSKPQPRNTEKASIKNIRLDNKAKTAIQIIKYDSYNRFELNEEAEEVFFFNFIQIIILFI